MNYKINTPLFWRRKYSIISILLWPISMLYIFIHRCHYYFQTPIKFKIPIICIGNVTVGGSGKTPLALALGKLLLQKKYSIAYVCKNYKATIRQATRVNKFHNSPQIIDEAMLLVKIAPTFVAQNRLDAIKLATKIKPDFIIVDDGLQNNSFIKDVSMLVVDENLNNQNKFLFPAGPYRETLENGIKISDIICLINSQKENNKIFSIPTINVTTSYQLTKRIKACLAFTGIAYPEKFFTSLEKLNVNIIKKIPFPDHHNYTIKELDDLIKDASQQNLKLITTEKDIVRIPLSYHNKIHCLKINFKIMQPNKLLTIIKNKCKK